MSGTEDGPATPGWVETELDEILAPLPATPGVRAARGGYLDCLARCRLPADPEEGHDRCRMRFLAALAHAGIGDDVLAALEPRLEALEAEISERT